MLTELLGPIVIALLLLLRLIVPLALAIIAGTLIERRRMAREGGQP